MAGEMLLHATCVSIDGQGVLLLGPPGAGKSDLALRLIDAPGRGTGGALAIALLVSDDQVLVARNGSALFASPPAPTAGMLEMRGFGILRVLFEPAVRLRLAVRLEPVARIERMPDAAQSRFEALGLALPQVMIDAAGASAAARVRAALASL